MRTSLGDVMKNRNLIIPKLLLIFLYSPLVIASDKPIQRDCGPPAPGTTFDKNCKLVSVPPPIQNQGEAEVIGEVIEVKCGLKTEAFQEYIADFRVEKIIRGKVENTVRLKFNRYNNAEPRLGDSGISFLKGDRSKLILTRYKDYWAVQFPFHKDVIRASGGLLPNCSKRR